MAAPLVDDGAEVDNGSLVDDGSLVDVSVPDGGEAPDSGSGDAASAGADAGAAGAAGVQGAWFSHSNTFGVTACESATQSDTGLVTRVMSWVREPVETTLSSFLPPLLVFTVETATR
ncbi:MAG: hypothetical protein ACK4UY_05400 [Dietzia sp.]